MARIVLAMSGGVDSSVAAHLLRDAGHEVIGLFMRHGEPAPVACGSAATAPGRAGADRPAGHKQGCCSAADAADARRVADRLDIPFYAIDFQEEFGRIIDYFVLEYTSARTPNPCIVCNNWLKFGRLFDFADTAGADAVATGHYARIRAGPAPASPALLRGVDPDKDQSYVLFGVRRERLARMMMPLGGYRKQAIRELADRACLWPPSATARRSVSSVPAGTTRWSGRGRRPGTPRDRLSTPEATWSGGTKGSSGLRSVSARGWAWR